MNDMPQCVTQINAAFGSAHILSHRELLKHLAINGIETYGIWRGSTVDLMTEQMVYGCRVYSNVANGANVPAAYTIDHAQLPLFAHDHSRICNRAFWWLRDVASETNFAIVTDNGACDSRKATFAAGARPAFGIKA